MDMNTALVAATGVFLRYLIPFITAKARTGCQWNPKYLWRMGLALLALTLASIVVMNNPTVFGDIDISSYAEMILALAAGVGVGEMANGTGKMVEPKDV